MKTFLKIFGSLIVLAIIAISIFLWTFDLNSYRGYITEKLSASLGHPVSIDRLEMKLSLIPTIKASTIRIDNPDTIQDSKPLFLSNSAEITVALAPLLSHRLEIQKVLFGTSFINLVEQNGQNNWSVPSNGNSKPKRESTHSQSSWFHEMRFDNIAFERTTVLFKSDKTNFNAEITDASIKQLKLFSFTLTHNKQTFKFSGNGNDILLFLAGEPNYVFNLELSHPTLTAKLNGNIGDTQKFQNMVFNFTLSSDNLKEVFKKFKINDSSVPSLPFEVKAALQGNLNAMDIVKFNANLGSNKLDLSSTGTLETLAQTPFISLNGTLTLSDAQLAQSFGLRPLSTRFELAANSSKITLTNLTLQANRSDIQLTSEITNLANRPQVNLSATSEYLNTADFLFQSQKAYAPTPVAPIIPAQRQIPDAKWDLSILKQFDMVARFDIPHMKFSDKFTGYLGLEGNLALKNGQLKTDSLKGTLLGGTLSGEIDVDVSQPDPRYQVQLSGKNLDLNQITPLNSIVQDAVLDTAVNVNTVGNSLYTTLAHLNGDATIELSKGTIISKWFSELPIVELVARQKTSSVSFSNSDKISQILCGAAQFDIRDGIITSQNNIALETSSVNFQLGGSLNLANEAINLNIRPILNTANDKINALLSTSQLVTIVGTLSQPEPILNTDNVIGQVHSVLSTKTLQPYELCQQILKKPTQAQQREKATQSTVLSFPKTSPDLEKKETPKDQLKQQLLNTLQEALKQ